MMELVPANSARTASIEHRIFRVRAAMVGQGIDRLLAYGWGRHSFLDFNPAWYLSGFKQLGNHCVVVIEANGDPWILVEPEWDAERARRWSVVEVVAVADVLEYLRRRASAERWQREHVAIATGTDPWLSEVERWEPIIGTTPVPATGLVSEISQVRDRWSLRLIDEATAIAEASYASALTLARPGLPEHQLHAAVDLRGRELGAEDNFLLMSASQHNYCVHQPTDRRLETGDIVLAEITPGVQGEFAQICRTFIVGREPSITQRECFNLLSHSLRQGIAAAHPGAFIGDVVNAINAPLAHAGYEGYIRPPYMRIRGHANGLGTPVPQLTPGSRGVLQRDMSFVLHPNQYLPETGYLMCGEPVVITESGSRILTAAEGTLGRC